MKKNYLIHSLFALFIFFSPQVLAQQSLYYDFRNTFDEKNGLAPALNVLGTGSFIDESLPDLSCLERTAYSFTQNSGVQFDNGTGGNIIGASYSIEMYFKFSINTGFMRIIDFKNRTSDFGLYATSNLLQFYDELTVGTTAFAANQYVHLVITRDGTTNDVNLFIDGVFLGTFNDVGGSALLDNSNVLNFFQDDLVFGGEARPGTIALLKMYNTPIDAVTVLDNFNNLETTSGAVAFSPDVLSTCLTGNVFNFVNESGNVGAITYNWEFGDGNGAVGVDASHSYLSDGFYDVLLIADDGLGCVDSATVTVEVYLVPFVTLGSDFDICDGDFAILDPGPGYASYLWTGGTTDSVLIVSQAGIYTVEVSDINGCTGTADIEIGIIIPPIVNLGADTTLCFGTSIQLSAPGGNFAYLWSTGEVTENIIVSAADTFFVEVVDFDGCIAVDTVVIDFYPELIITLSANISACDGDTVMLNAGSGFVSYLWSDASTDSVLFVLTTNSYTVEVTDVNGCTAVASSNVIFDAAPIVDLGADITICGGTLTTLDAGGGFITYLWNDGTTNQTLDITSGGTYTVTVTNAGGCTGFDEIVVDADPFVTLGNNQTVCEGDTITLDPGPIYTTYLWSDGTTFQTLDVSTSGIYTLTVTDINGCSNITEVEVTFNTLPVVNLGDTITVCDGNVAILDAGAGFDTYLWNDASTGQTLTVLIPGTYMVTVTDLAGCSGTDSVIVDIASLPIVDLGLDLNICDGDTYMLDGGPGMALYEWSNGSFTQTILVSTAGTYTVTITDANGCTASDDINIGIIAPPVVALGNDTILCAGEQLTLDAGAGFNGYLWNDGSIMQMLTVDSAGQYFVTVTDVNGCTGIDDITIGVFAPLVVTLGNDTILCAGELLTLDAGAGFNDYLWNDGSIMQMLTVDSIGLYFVTVTDVNGCSGYNEIQVDYYAPVPTPTISQNGNTLQSSSPTGNQWYEVPGGLIVGATGDTYEPGQDGTYYVVVTDANGCISEQSIDYVFIFVGISEVNAFSFTMAPNPANDAITISSYGMFNGDLKLELTDMLGRIVFTDVIQRGQNYRLSLSEYDQGIYFVRLSSKEYKTTKRLIISR